jgi:hypothetical protein
MSARAYTCLSRHIVFWGTVSVAKSLPQAVKMGYSGARWVVVH